MTFREKLHNKWNEATKLGYDTRSQKLDGLQNMDKL